MKVLAELKKNRIVGIALIKYVKLNKEKQTLIWGRLILF